MTQTDPTAPSLPGQEPPTFAMSREGSSLLATGVRRQVENATLASVRGLRGFLSQAADGPRILVGAFPFDRAAPGRLYQPATLDTAWTPSSATPATPGRFRSIRSEPSEAGYGEAVAKALDLMRSEGGVLRKIVLSRSLVLEADAPIDPLALLLRLSVDPSVTAFQAPLDLDAGSAGRSLVGATPELLVSKSGRVVASHPLAGSAARGAEAAEDERVAQALLRSDKDRREHATVVEAVLDTLAPYCRHLHAPQGTTLSSTRTMWHLGTRITGELKDPEVGSLELAAALHPTPAVGGQPTDVAEALIPGLESYDRGFYSGFVGWTDDQGDGRWFVSLRCAEIDGTKAKIYAGAGVVLGSDPAAETAETSAKFRALLSALGVEEPSERRLATTTP